jgi:phosphatidylinositol dimannoside acyltransferase
MGGRRAMVTRHQRRAAPAGRTPAEIDAAVAGAFDSYALYWYEMLRLPLAVRRGEVSAHVTMKGYEHILAGLEAGNGVIVALPHLGGWEYAAAWMALQGHRMLAVVERLEPPELYDWFAGQRGGIGLDIVPAGAGALTELLRAFRDNRIVCLVSDRDLSGDGVTVRFFDETTTLPGGPAVLALRSGATLLAAAVYFRPDGMHAAVLRPVPAERTGRLRDDVARITQALADEFEALIRVAPDQWHLMQPNWPSDHDHHRDHDHRDHSDRGE